MSRPQLAASEADTRISHGPSRPANEDARLAALQRYHILDTPFEAEYDDIARIAAQVCEAPIAVVNFVDRERQWFKSEIGLGIRETLLDVSICAHAMLQQGLFIVPDTLADPRFACNPLVTGEPHLRFYAGALLQTSDGFPLGTLCVLDYKPRELNDEQKRTLEALARQVMTLLELRRANALQGETLVALERAAGEKAVLLEELQHRVKNNVQMMSGLVQLQSRREPAPEAREALDKLRRRLEALVLLNSQFDGARSTDRVDLAAYLRRLCVNLTEFTAASSDTVKLDLDLSPMEVRSDLALRLGMIANEFITNSFKHAFSGGQGRLAVKLSHRPGGAAQLELADDGPGLPASVREDGLGLQIIPSLARQIRASIEWPAGAGARLVVTWQTG